MDKKYYITLAGIVLALTLGFGLYNDICQSSPECACKNSSPGDVTCMSTEGLTQWCLSQPNPIALPQCMGLKEVYPVEKIVQRIIDFEGLQPFLHPEIDGRVPLIISEHLINMNLKLKKFGSKVQIIPDKNIEGAVFRFTVFDCKYGSYCNVAFEYKVEGIVGNTGVRIKKDGSIKLEKTNIVKN